MSDTIRSETLMEDYNKMLRENIKLKKREKKLVELVLDLSKVRLYNSANIFKGPMIRDKGMVHDVVMRAREVLKDLGVEYADDK